MDFLKIIINRAFVVSSQMEIACSRHKAIFEFSYEGESPEFYRLWGAQIFTSFIRDVCDESDPASENSKKSYF